jgi:hypothetical protein
VEQAVTEKTQYFYSSLFVAAGAGVKVAKHGIMEFPLFLVLVMMEN